MNEAAAELDFERAARLRHLAQLGQPKELEEGGQILKALKAPVRMMVGEHDWYLDMGEVWRKQFGKDTYSFDHKGVHFIVLDNVTDPGAKLGDAQLAWLAAVLAGAAMLLSPVARAEEPKFRIGVVTFLVRIVLHADSNQPLNSHLWAWPEYIAMFSLGVAAARRGWLRPVPAALARQGTLFDTLRTGLYNTVPPALKMPPP